jgi:Zn-finger nucleic acid-binding protein
MKCARCDWQIREQTHLGVLVDRCAKCGGVWLDDGELPQLLRDPKFVVSEDNQKAALEQRQAGISEVEKKADLRCPRCNQKTDAVNYDYSSGVILNRCAHGHGLWLDAGELERIAAFRMAARRDAEIRAPELSGKLSREREEASVTGGGGDGIFIGPIIRFFQRYFG